MDSYPHPRARLRKDFWHTPSFSHHYCRSIRNKVVLKGLFGQMTNRSSVLRKARRSVSYVRGQDCMVLRRVQGQ